MIFKIIKHLWQIEILILLVVIMMVSHCSCTTVKPGNTIQVKVLKHTAKLQGKSHRLVWGVPNHSLRNFKK